MGQGCRALKEARCTPNRLCRKGKEQRRRRPSSREFARRRRFYLVRECWTTGTREGPGTVAHGSGSGREGRPVGDDTRIHPVARRQPRNGCRGLWERAPRAGQRASPGRAPAVAPAEFRQLL